MLNNKKKMSDFYVFRRCLVYKHINFNFNMLSWTIIIIVSVPCEIKYRPLETILPQTINGKELENRELIELLTIYIIYFDKDQLSVQLTMFFI